jgi:hypothetical protein
MRERTLPAPASAESGLAGSADLAWRFLRSSIEWFGELGIFCVRLARAAVTPPYEIREFVRQLDEVGSKSMLLVALAGSDRRRFPSRSATP